jgi:adenosylcobinamide-phosphate synthase
VALLLVVAIGGWALQARRGRCRAHGAGWPAAMAWPALAQRSLHDHVRAVMPLRSGDLAQARRAVGMIVGRDTAALDADAALPARPSKACRKLLRWRGCAAVLAGGGGAAGVWAYKALNTADSLIGHPEPDLRAFGWAAARADDAANWLPAPGGLVLCLAAGRGGRIMWRDCRRHASPNAGWPEAAMAGALGRRWPGRSAMMARCATSPGSARWPPAWRDLPAPWQSIAAPA